MVREKTSFKDYKYVQIFECEGNDGDVELIREFVRNGRVEEQVSVLVINLLS